MSASADSYDFIVVGCGAAGLSAAVNYVETAKLQGRTPRVAVLESAPKEQRGGATRWTTARFRAREDFSLDPHFVGKVAKVSKDYPTWTIAACWNGKCRPRCASSKATA